MTMTIDLKPTSFHNATVTANRLEKNVTLIIKDSNDNIIKLPMSVYAAERLWRALESCVVYTETRE
jgi:hypothetical protein